MIDEEDTEEVVLTRWGKIKQWVEIVVATKKAAMLLWGVIFSVGGTATVGLITDTNPLRDAAIEVGLVEADPIDTTTGILREELMLQLATMQQEIIDLKAHQHNYPNPVWPKHSHPKPAWPQHNHPDPKWPAHSHPAQKPLSHAHPEINAMIPDKHKRLH